MKKVFHLLLCIIFSSQLLTLNLSCTQDAYDKGEGKYSQMTAEMVDAYTASDKRITAFVTDDGVRYTVDSPFSVGYMSKPDTVYRAVFFFSKTEKGADVKGLNRVGVPVPQKIAEMKTDPVRIESMWLSKTRRYLNLSLQLMVGATDSKDVVHKIGCHIDTLMTNADGTHTLHLTLYHDQNGMPQHYTQRSYFSVPMPAEAADSVMLTVNTYDGVETRAFKLKN